jgi:hypothetical protein
MASAPERPRIERTMPRARLLLAVATAACVLALSPARAETVSSEAELARMRELAQDLARSYLRLWSDSDTGALADVGVVYADRIAFYGRFLTQRELAAEKQRFLRRWPIRHYAIRPGTLKSDCDAVLRVCQVDSIIDWNVADPARHKSSRGSSRFALGIDFAGPQPVVRGENGRVLARR